MIDDDLDYIRSLPILLQQRSALDSLIWWEGCGLSSMEPLDIGAWWN